MFELIINFMMVFVLLFCENSLGSVSQDYDASYWNWQKEVGRAGGVLNKFKFEDFVNKDNVVLDIGCGGGFLLKEFDCKKRMGVEINPHAIKHARSLGVEVYEDLQLVEDGIVDVIVSNHAFEHIPTPYETLKIAKNKLKSNGLIVIVVPSEQAVNSSYGYTENDPNHHLFTWTPLTLANLLKLAGFKIIKAEALRHCWTGNYMKQSQNKDLTEYHKQCRKHALETNNYQVRVVAQKVS